MEITRELKMSIANEYSAIKSVEVEYEDGEIISGFVKNATFTPLNVTLCKLHVSKGEDQYYLIDFNKTNKITLIYYNGTIKIFE